MMETLQTIWRERWESRRKLTGWLHAGFGLLLVLFLLALSLSSEVAGDQGAMRTMAGVFILEIAGGIGYARGHGWGAVILCVFAVIYLVAFPIGTLFGGYTLWVLFNTRDQTGTSRPALITATAIPALLVLFTKLPLGNSLESAADRQLLAAVKEQGGQALYARWLRGVPDDSARRADSIKRVVMSGVLRLDSADQLARFQLVYDRLAESSTSDCAAVGRGRATMDATERLMTGLDSARLRTLMAVTARSILAELRHDPPRLVASDSDVAAYGRALYGSLSARDQSRFSRVADSVATVSDSDACWFVLRMLSRALQPDPSRERWVRVMATLSVRSE